MTIADVRARVARIAALAEGVIPAPSRSAAAHEEEDRLYRDVLQAIAGGAPRARALAVEALRAMTVRFDRWYE